jgi:hypothetical protein
MPLRKAVGEILAKPHIFAQTDPEQAVEAALRDLGYPWATYVSKECYVRMFASLIDEFVKRERDAAEEKS